MLSTVGILAMSALILTVAPIAIAQSTDAAASSGQQQAVMHEGAGVVTAVEPDAHPQTVVVETKAGNQEMTVGAYVFDQTKITEGRSEKGLGDVKVGDRVWIRWKKTDDALIADSIRILGPANQAAQG